MRKSRFTESHIVGILKESQGLQPPPQDYGGLAWVSFTLPTGATGYWAPKGDGTYYYLGPDGTLYDDPYQGEVQPNGVATDGVGNASTYDFYSADASNITSSYNSVDQFYYGGLYA